MGSNKYTTEILHLIYNLKYIWQPEFGNIMQDNHLVNISGVPDHFMGADLNIEHNIGNIKETYCAKGIHADWDHLGDISASTTHTQAAKKKVAQALERKKLLEYDTNQKLNLPVKLSHITDIQEDGYQKLRWLITSFNKRMKAQWLEDIGDAPEMEHDKLPPMQWGTTEAV
ncbi:hypothetical protein BDP27DRAFT_1422649 [Rhodocollybia butyracea]|uniref:DUF6589 domain-containing protein n=1 Tax=Rhodocollybia butyracea TaxID=206335 RepID=A0A9P5PT66_9AGAR|nr:hypothetical protein BDP27DRAFT_1422649 [Rhodocollybia butyracea]